VLVVDDGSSDDTPVILAGRGDVHVISHERNLGYGAALRSAFQFALDQGYDVLVTIDCDGQHQPALIPELAAQVYPADAEPVDIVSGSRYLRHFEGDSTPPADRRRINLEITRMINERLGLQLTDAFCGFKAYRVEALRCLNITELGYAMPLQLWAQAAALGLRIVEYPVPLIYLEEQRSFGGSLDDARRRMAYYQEVLERELKSSALLPCCGATARD
jgi:glycosyltransferase involved in cell wall biosynthesis